MLKKIGNSGFEGKLHAPKVSEGEMTEVAEQRRARCGHVLGGTFRQLGCILNKSSAHSFQQEVWFEAWDTSSNLLVQIGIS